MALTPKNIDTLDQGALQEDLGNTYGVGLLLSNPELMLIAYKSQGFVNAKIDRKTGKIVPGKNDGSSWDANKVGTAITQSKWYSQYDGNQRAAQNAKATDIGSWNTRVANLEAQIQEQATAAGADLTGVDVKSFAEKALTDNFNYMSGNADAKLPERLVNTWLAPHIKAEADGTFSGQAQVNASTLRKRAEDYGVTLSDQWYADAIQNLQAGKITDADLTKQIVNNSKSRYQSLAAQIDETTSLKSLADPYVQLYAQTMEQAPAGIGIEHPDIQAALQVTDPSTGAVRSKSLWEFQQDLRKKPEWGNTTQGRRELNAGAMSMLKSFGFVS